MNLPQIFNFDQHEVRTVVINDEPFFIGKEIAELLGYSNSRKALNDHVDPEDKIILTSRIVTLENMPNRGLIGINESGLYSLAIKSGLPSAKKFQRWITKEVLPQIRKHGMYATDELLDNPDLLIEVATKLKEERRLRVSAETDKLIAEKRVKELQPKANYYDTILANRTVVAISFIAKNYGMSATEMNKLLHKYGIQYKLGKARLLYAKFQNEGYTHTEMVPVKGSGELKPIMKWTPKGHVFIYEFLKRQDILPTIERLF